MSLSICRFAGSSALSAAAAAIIGGAAIALPGTANASTFPAGPSPGRANSSPGRRRAVRTDSLFGHRDTREKAPRARMAQEALLRQRQEFATQQRQALLPPDRSSRTARGRRKRSLTAPRRPPPVPPGWWAPASKGKRPGQPVRGNKIMLGNPLPLTTPFAAVGESEQHPIDSAPRAVPGQRCRGALPHAHHARSARQPPVKKCLHVDDLVGPPTAPQPFPSHLSHV